MYVIDDFLPFYTKVMERLILFRFFTNEESEQIYRAGDRWKGTRTGNLVEHMPGLTGYIQASLQIKLRYMHIHRHNAMPDVQGQLHTDGDFRTAGVIYLQGGPGCGTEVDGKLVEYRTNRLVTYNAQLEHRPQGFTHPRMVVTFFSRDPLPDNLDISGR